jgi:hypothetical protein
VEFAARLFAFFVTQNAPGTALNEFTGVEVAGSIPRGADTVIVVYRYLLPTDQPPLRSWQTKTLRRYGSEWRVDMLADFSGLLTTLAGRRRP